MPTASSTAENSAALRIDLCITRLIRGGAQLLVLELARRLARTFRLRVLAGPQTGSEGSLWQAFADAGIETREVPSLGRALNPLKDARALNELTAILRESPPHLLHTHTSKAGLIGAFAARKAGVPVVYTPHGHIFAKQARIPGVPSAGPKRWLLKALRRAAHRHSAFTVALNEHDRDDHIRLGLCDPSKLRIIHNGIDTARFVPHSEARRMQLREHFQLPPEGKVVGFAGRLTAEKGVEILAEVAHQMKDRADVNFLVAGDGPLRSRLEGLENLHLIGQQQDMSMVYPAMDVLCVPSAYESQGLSGLEALACGVPVVAHAVGGLPSAVIDGVTGLLVQPNHPRALKHALELVLADGPTRENLSRQGRAHVMQHFSLERMVLEYAELYREVAATGGCP